MVTDDERDWLVAETANLIARVGIDSYVAAPLVEANDRFFPDEWHPDAGGVLRLAARVFALAGVGDIELSADLADHDTGYGITVEHADATSIRFIVDPQHLGDALAVVTTLVHFATGAFRERHELAAADEEHELRLLDLTSVYLGFGIITTNAAYRYRASGEMQGNTAITRWAHHEQTALLAHAMAYALAMQLVARGADANELRAVKRQLETNQAEAFEAACRELDREHLVLLLDLPPRETWPAPRTAPASKQLVRKKQPELPTARLKSTTYLGFNSGKPVLRLQQTRTVELGFASIFVALFAVIAIAVQGHGVIAMLTLVAMAIAGFVGGHRIRRDVCVGRGCGVTLPGDVERCPRCGGTIAGRMLKGENLLEAEERLQLDDGDDEIDYGEASEGVGLSPVGDSQGLPNARVHAGGRNAGVEGSSNTRIG